MLVDDFGYDGRFLSSLMAASTAFGAKRKYENATQVIDIVSVLSACCLMSEFRYTLCREIEWLGAIIKLFELN